MTSSTLGEAADVECPNQEEGRSKKLAGGGGGQSQAGPPAGSFFSRVQLLEEDWGAASNQQPQFLTILKHQS